MTQAQRRVYLIQYLLNEQEEYKGIQIPDTVLEQKKLLRALMNVRFAKKCSCEFYEIQDAYLQKEIKEKGIHTISKSGISIWQGDITTLKVDAIVNAANSQMTGCYYPNHTCIDNCIHTYAGMQLRMYCQNMMNQQNCLEPTGKAKITPAFNLPSHYIFHTVGPIVQGKVTQKDCDDLKNCYISCLQLATQYHLESIAFCCISTGEFHFPNELAATIAVDTVKEYLKSNKTSLKTIIFNVFKDKDKQIYEKLI